MRNYSTELAVTGVCLCGMLYLLCIYNEDSNENLSEGIIGEYYPIPFQDYYKEIKEDNDVVETNNVFKPILKRPKVNNTNGENGKPLEIKWLSMDENNNVERNNLLEKYKIDIYISNLISVHRYIGESRRQVCIDKYNKGYDYDKLPKTSIIITVYNEALSTLLRGIFSILHTCPDQLVEEIIIVDDCSDLKTHPDLGIG